MPYSRASGHPTSPNPLREPVNSLAVMIQRTKRAIPRRTTPAAQIAFIAPVLEQLQQQQQQHEPSTSTTSRPTSIYHDRQLRSDNIYEVQLLPPLQRIPVRRFFRHWLAAVGERKARRQFRQGRGLRGEEEETGANGREMERGPWAPALHTRDPGSESEVQQPDDDTMWMRNIDASTPVSPDPVPPMPDPSYAELRRRRAVARHEALLFSRWLRASVMSASASTYVGAADADADAMAVVVYASSPAPSLSASTSTRVATPTTTATALWRVLVRLIYELLRHLPRTDMLFPRRERGRLSRDAFRRFMALANSTSTSTSTPTSTSVHRAGAAEQVGEDALEAGVDILEALASLTNRDNDNDNEVEHEHEQGHDGERDANANAAEAERERIRMAREHRQMWKKRQQPMVVIVDLTEVPTERERQAEMEMGRCLSGLVPPPPPPPPRNSHRPLLLYQRFVAALEAFTERNRAALLLVGRDGVCRMRVAFVDPARSRLESEWSDGRGE